MLIFADDCTGAAGSPPDPALWGLEVTQPWQNAADQQCYTTDPRNAQYNGAGQLVIKAIKEPTNGKAYSSARIGTRALTSPRLFRYGLFRARIKVPTVVGAFPAWWLTGVSEPEVGWPRCGEIDIMEAPAGPATLGQVHQGVHGPKAGTDADLNVKAGVSTAAAGWGGWHMYWADWRPGEVQFGIDHRTTGTVTRAQVEAAGGRWVLDYSPLSLVLNLAVGGWAGTPDPSWSQASMLVDCVRVWAR